MELLVYGFGPGSDFAGHLVGGVQRVEGGGAIRIADALFVQRDADTGEIAAVTLEGRRMDAMIASLLEFRLDDARRRRITERALGAGGVQALADALAPGSALLALLIEHVWAQALQDAVTRTGGARLVDDDVEAGSLASLTGRLVDAARAVAGAA